MSLSLVEIASRLGGELIGATDTRVEQVAPLGRARAGEIGFVAQARYKAALDSTHASAVIVPRALADATFLPRIVADDPYLYFAQVAQLLNPEPAAAMGIHPSAVVLSELPGSVSIGALAYIGEGCTVGEDVIVGPGVVVETGCSIGDGTMLRANSTLCRDTVVGARCLIHSGVVLGSDGFGFARWPDGKWEKIPQIGRVVVGDDVEVGANCAIDRGALDDTVIERGVKLDNLVHVAHNCTLGEDSAIAGQVGMAGSAKLGKRVMVGGQAGILGHIEIGDDVVLTGRSFMSKTTMEKGVYSSLIPAQPHREWMRVAAQLNHLNELVERVRNLEKQIKELENKA